jgi:N-acetylglucosamine repressor
LSFKRLISELSLGQEHVLDSIHLEIRRFLEQDSKIRGIGIAHSGVIDHTSGTVLFWPRVAGWRDVRLKQVFKEKFGLTTVVEDSARTVAISEQRFGYGRSQRNFVCIDAGVGIGAAIFVDGRPYFGCDGMAGELGHTTIDESGDICSCGNRGCLELYASGSAIIDKVRAGLEQGAASSLADLAAKHPENVSIEAIAAAAESHDRLCQTVLEEAGTHLGTALASIVNLLNPERIILGGALPRVARRSLLDPLLRSLRSRAFHRSVSRVEVVVSELGEEASAVGACLLTAERVLDELCAAENTDVPVFAFQASSTVNDAPPAKKAAPNSSNPTTPTPIRNRCR